MYPLSDILLLHFYRTRLEEAMRKARSSTGHRRGRASPPQDDVRLVAVAPRWGRFPEVV